jgi:hypothetical protein
VEAVELAQQLLALFIVHDSTVSTELKHEAPELYPHDWAARDSTLSLFALPANTLQHPPLKLRHVEFWLHTGSYNWYMVSRVTCKAVPLTSEGGLSFMQAITGSPGVGVDRHPHIHWREVMETPSLLASSRCVVVKLPPAARD